jgi:hypothetical protein
VDCGAGGDRHVRHLASDGVVTTAALEKAVDHLCDFMDALGAHFPAPSMEIIGRGTVFRHPAHR